MNTKAIAVVIAFCALASLLLGIVNYCGQRDLRLRQEKLADCCSRAREETPVPEKKAERKKVRRADKVKKKPDGVSREESDPATMRKKVDLGTTIELIPRK